MVNLPQLALSILSLSWGDWFEGPTIPLLKQTSFDASHPSHQPVNVTKSIAIVGAGSAGLAVLKTLLGLPEEVRTSWDIVLFEQRRDVGGVWLPDLSPPHPPIIPETPLYPRLHTNTPHPTMTYPGFTFPPNTPLFPSWDYLQRYHRDFAEHFNLTSHIRLNHTVVAAGWLGNRTSGKWDVEVAHNDQPFETQHHFFDHLIVANGHNHYPRTPHWDGEDEWLASTPSGTPKREILHSIFYREPEHYANRTVVIVGGGASGRDAALQVGPLAKVYQSLHDGTPPTEGAQVTLKPPIFRFTNHSIIFTDGSSLESVDSIILATGYQFLVPFLSRIPSKSGLDSPALLTDRQTTTNSTTAPALTTNSRYIFPLHQHIFSLSRQHPTTALAFIGLPILIANCPSDIAQSLYVAHAIANPDVLPSYDEMLQSLVDQEERRAVTGYDPYFYGHKMIGGDVEAQNYQDDLVQYLKDHGELPQDGKKYVEQWRRDAREKSKLLGRAWARIEAAGQQAEWLEGVETEEEWADVMAEMTVWQERWEAEHGQNATTVSLQDVYVL